MVPVARAGNLTVTGAVRVSLYQPATEFENLAYVDTDPPLLAAGTNSGLTLGWREAEDLGLEGPESFHMKGCSAEVLRKFSEEKLSVRGSAHTEDGLRFAISSYQGNVCIWERSLSATAGPTFGWKLEAAFEVMLSNPSYLIPSPPLPLLLPTNLIILPIYVRTYLATYLACCVPRSLFTHVPSLPSYVPTYVPT